MDRCEFTDKTLALSDVVRTDISMYTKKILSIIVPSFNMEDYLRKCLSSLVVDGVDLFQKLDVIVVNDGSKDRTSEIAHEFEKEYPGVFRVIDKANGHYGSCINAALTIANGRYVKILDADDSFNTRALSLFIRELDLLSACTDVVFTDYDIVDEQGQVTEHIHYPFPKQGVFGLSEVVREKVAIHMHGLTYRLQVLKDIQYRQMEGLCFTDTQWSFDPFAVAATCRYIPCSLYRYLLGRPGQSVDPHFENRNAAMLVKVLKGILKNYKAVDNRVADSNRRMLDNQILNFLRVVYGSVLWKVSIRYALCCYADMDDEVLRLNARIYKIFASEFGSKIKPVILLRRFKYMRWIALPFMRISRQVFRRR